MDSRPSRSRKRSSAWIEAEENEHVSLAFTPVNTADLPSKRLQNSQGVPVNAKAVLKYDAQKLLSNLAFTRFYVTANFQNFSPTISSIILCMVSEQNELYQALCHVLPSLYSVSPSLQALAVTTGYLDPNATADQTLQRTLPLITTAGIDSRIVEEFESFRRNLSNPEACIAVIAPDGSCVWNSTEFSNTLPRTKEDIMSLQWQIVNALTAGKGTDTEMTGG